MQKSKQIESHPITRKTCNLASKVIENKEMKGSNIGNKCSTNQSKISNALSSTATKNSLTKGASNRTSHLPIHTSNMITNHSNQTTSIESKYQCQLCELNFYTIERYNFHLIKIHKIDQRINYLQCYVKECQDKFKKRMQLVDHLNDVHSLGVVVLTKTVQNLDEFIKWKDKVEKESGFTWIQNNKFYLNNRLRKTYICNKPTTNGCKVYSLHGVTTINNHSTFCLSSIKVTENDDGTFYIEFVETHNHDE